MSTAAYALPDRELVLDRYRPLKPIGRGGSGSVWLARDESSGLEVALKIVPREGKRAARAMREMEAASRLRHERCVRAYDFGGDDGHVYIAYEYVRGSTVRELLRAGKLSDRDAVEVAAQVLDGLAHAHARGIVHRDVKPSNVLVEDIHPLSVRLLDFGLAQFEETDTLTAIGDVPGTLAYISPERLTGGEATTKSDVWGVGVMLWEALAGQHPFWGVPLPQVPATIAEGAPPLEAERRDLPPRLVRVIETALAVNPAQRPSARRLAHDLREAFLTAGSPRDRNPSRGRRPQAVAAQTPRPSRKIRLARAPQAALAGGATAGGAMLLPFWSPGLIALLALAAAAAALRAPRLAIAVGLAAPVLPLGNVAQGAAVLYAVIAAAWLAVVWRDQRMGFLFALGPLLAPLGLIGLLPLAAQPARAWWRRGLHTTMGVLCAGLTGALMTGTFPLTEEPALPLELAATEDPLVVANALWGQAAGQSGLLITALVLGFTAAALPFARARSKLSIGALCLFQLSAIVMLAPTVARPAILLATATLAAVTVVRPGQLPVAFRRPLATER